MSGRRLLTCGASIPAAYTTRTPPARLFLSVELLAREHARMLAATATRIAALERTDPTMRLAAIARRIAALERTDAARRK